MGEKEKGGMCGEATKGVPTKGASAPCKGKSAGKRKKVEENRRKRGSTHGQATRSAARMEEELSKRAEKKSRGALWKRRPRKGVIVRARMVYKRGSSVVSSIQKIQQKEMSCKGE